MQLGAFSSMAFSICTWFYRLAFINLLWIIFTLLGLVVLGFFPATVAMLATLRQYLNKNEVNLFPYFWGYYKKEFIESNKLGGIITSIGLILYINLNFLQINKTGITEFLYFSSVTLSFLYLLIICYLLASYVEFNLDLKTHIKNSVLIAIYNPLASLFIIFGFVTVYYAVTFISGLGFFFSASMFGIVILSSANIAYRKIQQKQEKLQTNT
ncbi:YesL family protein [Salipaludibacillus sp. HK11]|uniref:YesL family protein n=1 Tax=Salipaludibacillus sp. HK11 TaxID=3394320 RepID=UPI0039FC90A8